MAGLDEGTVDFHPTYNGEEEEPEIFPGLFPSGFFRSRYLNWLSALFHHAFFWRDAFLFGKPFAFRKSCVRSWRRSARAVTYIGR